MRLQVHIGAVQNVPLLGRERPSQYPRRHIQQPLIKAAARLDRPLRQRPRRLHKLRVIHRRQRLQRRVRPLPPHRAVLPRRRVKQLHRRRRRAPLPEPVHAATVQLLPVVPLVELGVAAVHRDGLPNALRLVRLHARPADSRVQQPAHRQRRIPHHFPVHPVPRPARQQPVLRVFLQLLRRHQSRLPVGVRQQHQLQHLLHVPTRLTELDREPVQQLRMRRRRPLRPEILGRLHNPRPENLLPEPVDRHPRRQRIRRIHHPLRQPQPVPRQARIHRRQHARHVRLHLFPRRIVHAPVQDVGLGLCVRSLLHHQRHRAPLPDRPRLGLERRQLGVQPTILLIVQRQVPQPVRHRPLLHDESLLRRNRPVEDLELRNRPALKTAQVLLAQQQRSARRNAPGQPRVLVSPALQRDHLAVQIHPQPRLLPRPVVGHREVVPRPLLQLRQMRRLHRDRLPVVPGQPEQRHARPDVESPAHVLPLRVILAGHREGVLPARKVDPRRDRKGLIGVERRLVRQRHKLAFAEANRLLPRRFPHSDLRRAQVRLPQRKHLRLWLQRRLVVAMLRHNTASPQRHPLGFQRRHLLLQRFPPRPVLSPRHHHDRRRIRLVIVHRVLGRVPEERRQRIEVLLRQRVKLVVVARRAANRQPHEDGTRRVHPVLRVDGQYLVLDDPGLVGRNPAAVEAARHLLLQRPVR